MGRETQLHITERKRSSQQCLAERINLLQSRGLDETGIQKDRAVQKIRARIRQANRQLARLADQEKLNRQAAKIKADKAAGPRQPKKETAGAAVKPKEKRKSREKNREVEASNG